MNRFFTKGEYQFLAAQYKIGHIKRLDYIRGGFQTPKVIVTTEKGKFVISSNRISNQRGDIIGKSKRSLEYELDLLRILKNLPVPHFLKDKRGKYIIDFRGSAVTIDQFIPGKQPKSITTRKAYRIGKFLGDFHNIGKRFNKKLAGRRRFYDLAPAVMRKMDFYVRKQKNPALRSVTAEVKRGVIENMIPKTLPTGPIHVDIKPENELFISDTLTGILDFGNFYVGPYMIDIGKTIMWNCIEKRKLDRKLIRAFLRGYESKRKLTTTEREYLKKSILFAIYSHIWVDLYHVPLRYVPESYTLSLVKNFLPVARSLEKESVL